jgi:hypothetical protein
LTEPGPATLPRGAMASQREEPCDQAARVVFSMAGGLRLALVALLHSRAGSGSAARAGLAVFRPVSAERVRPRGQVRTAATAETQIAASRATNAQTEDA